MHISNHREKLVDNNVHEKKIGSKGLELRKPHLKSLGILEEKIRSLCPLNYCTYDVVRFSRPWFREFSYTEMFGGILVSPTSSEISVKLSDYALRQPYQESPYLKEHLDSRLKNEGNLDKYNLKKKVSRTDIKKIAFLPGSNLFSEIVSKEILARLLWEDEEIFAKFHPFTQEHTIRAICADFGYDRFIDGNESGWDYLKNADTVYATSSSEMGLYAVLFDKELINIGNFFAEQKSAFYPIFRFVNNLPKDEAKRRLLHLLSSPYSGFFLPNDPNVEEKITSYFEKAMEFREPYRPMIFEPYSLQQIMHPVQPPPPPGQPPGR